jgi:hypothetical protein
MMIELLLAALLLLFARNSSPCHHPYPAPKQHKRG